MRIEREGLGDVPLAHRDERHGVDQTQPPRAALGQQVETGVVQRVVDADHLDERRKVRPKAPYGVETEAAADERIRFDQNKARRHECSLAGTEVGEGALRARVVLVLGIEECQERGRIHEDRTHSNASSRYRSCLVETSREPRRSRKRPTTRAARSYSAARTGVSSDSPFSTYRRMISASDTRRSWASARSRRACCSVS